MPALRGSGGLWGMGGGAASSLANTATSEVLSLVFGVPVVLRDPCAMLIEGDSLASNPLAELTEAPVLYDAGALTLTLGADGDFNELAESDFEVGDRFLWRFVANDRAQTGVYTLTDLGGEDSPAVWTRAADLNASGDLVRGLTFPVASDGGAVVLLRLTTSAPYVLDTTDLTFEQLTAETAA